MIEHFFVYRYPWRDHCGHPLASHLHWRSWVGRVCLCQLCGWSTSLVEGTKGRPWAPAYEEYCMIVRYSLAFGRKYIVYICRLRYEHPSTSSCYFQMKALNRDVSENMPRFRSRKSEFWKSWPDVFWLKRGGDCRSQCDLCKLPPARKSVRGRWMRTRLREQGGDISGTLWSCQRWNGHRWSWTVSGPLELTETLISWPKWYLLIGLCPSGH